MLIPFLRKLITDKGETPVVEAATVVPGACQRISMQYHRCIRTTIDIDDDVLQAAKELAAKQKSTTGKVISTLTRRALAATPVSRRTKNAVPVLPRRGDVITFDHVRTLIEQEAV